MVEEDVDINGVIERDDPVSTSHYIWNLEFFLLIYFDIDFFFMGLL